MKYILLPFVFLLLFSSCVNEGSIPTSPMPTATITIPSTDRPTRTPSLTITPFLIVSSTAIQIPNGFELYYEIWFKISVGDLKCSEFLWKDVGMEVKTGSVQPFIIQKEDSPPNAEILCSGYFVIPPEPGLGYFVYKDSESGIQVLPVTYTEDDITQNVSDSNKNTTPGPSQ